MKLITHEEYAAAILVLLPVAMRGTGQSGRCAQVLLSAYNGYDYHVSIPDLCGLDVDLYEAAITVIRGRCELLLEPHVLIQDGGRIFDELYDDWTNISVENRAKVWCGRCDGRGKIYSHYDDEIGTTCPRCNGAGRVCRCQA